MRILIVHQFGEWDVSADGEGAELILLDYSSDDCAPCKVDVLAPAELDPMWAEALAHIRNHKGRDDD